MEKLSSRTLTDGDRLIDTDEVVIFNGSEDIYFVVPASSGDGRQVYLKNISERDVTVHIEGLQDLSVPRMPAGNTMRLARNNNVQLGVFLVNKWIQL
jgi:hypothetical protein